MFPKKSSYTKKCTSHGLSTKSPPKKKKNAEHAQVNQAKVICWHSPSLLRNSRGSGEQLQPQLEVVRLEAVSTTVEVTTATLRRAWGKSMQGLLGLLNVPRWSFLEFAPYQYQKPPREKGKNI